MEEMKLNNVEEVMENTVESGKSGKSNVGKLVIAGLGAVAVGAIAFACKTKGAFEKRSIAKLEKKGYTIIKPEPMEAEEVEE